MPTFSNGDHVEFADFDNETVTHSGVVLNYLPPSGEFRGGYHVACYYVVPEKDLSKVEREFEAAQVAADGTVKPGIQLYSRRFDQSNKHWTNRVDDNVMFLLAQQNYAKDLLNSRGHVFLNDVQDMLGFDRTPQGQLVGWVKGGNGVDFGIDEIDAEPGVLILNLNPDGVIYDQI